MMDKPLDDLIKEEKQANKKAKTTKTNGKKATRGNRGRRGRGGRGRGGATRNATRGKKKSTRGKGGRGRGRGGGGAAKSSRGGKKKASRGGKKTAKNAVSRGVQLAKNVNKKKYSARGSSNRGRGRGGRGGRGRGRGGRGRGGYRGVQRGGSRGRGGRGRGGRRGGRGSTRGVNSYAQNTMRTNSWDQAQVVGDYIPLAYQSRTQFKKPNRTRINTSRLNGSGVRISTKKPSISTKSLRRAEPPALPQSMMQAPVHNPYEEKLEEVTKTDDFADYTISFENDQYVQPEESPDPSPRQKRRQRASRSGSPITLFSKKRKRKGSRSNELFSHIEGSD